MKQIIFLEPHDDARLTADYLKARPLESEIDLIKAFIGIPNLTHAWNQYGLSLSVVEQVQRKVRAIRPGLA